MSCCRDSGGGGFDKEPVLIMDAIPELKEPVISIIGVDFTGVSRERWEQFGHSLHGMGKSLMWWLGDWWIHGEREYGEMAAQAVEPGFGFSYETLSKAAYVCRKFPPESRRKELSFRHHQICAGLENREEMLQKAVEGKLSTRELQAETGTEKKQSYVQRLEELEKRVDILEDRLERNVEQTD